MTRRRLQWSFLGRLDYVRADALQRRLRERLQQGSGPEALLLLEHPHVYTLGRNADQTEVLVDREWLRAHRAEVVSSDRGGKVTYHGPGQLVGYPIVDLHPDRRDVRGYVRDLQEVLVRTLAIFGVGARPGRRSEEIGVWAGERKIASIGVHISRWITTHGFALNVTTDLSYFRAIVPCGLAGVEMTSIETLSGSAPALPDVAAVCARHFGEVFERTLVRVTPERLIERWPIAS